jgi:hypothetical protein
MIRTFFRIIDSKRPSPSHFRSHEALGIPLFDPDPEKTDMWRGISVFATLSQARNKARSFPHMGEHIAILEIDDAGPLMVARTGQGRGHHTVWGDSEEIFRCVVAVVHISFEAGDPSNED